MNSQKSFAIIGANDNYARNSNAMVHFKGHVMLETKEEIWLSPMTKARTPTEMSKEQNDNTKKKTHKNRNLNFGIESCIIF